MASAWSKTAAHAEDFGFHHSTMEIIITTILIIIVRI